MDKIRVSRSIMDSLNNKGYCHGTKFNYEVVNRLAINCIIVDRYPRYYYTHTGRKICTRQDAVNRHLIERVQVKGYR